MTEPNSMRLAILIDAENVQPVHADLIFSNAAAIGTVTAREIYGAAAALTTWVEPVLKYAIHPNLTIKAAKGKNSSDIALVIGAMDLVLGGEIDGVVIASSDSDFSSLSVRLRTAGLEVIGMGTEKANALWRTACSRFMVLEPPSQKTTPVQQPPQKQGPRQTQKAQAQQSQKPSQPQQSVQQPSQKQGANKPQKAAPANNHRERTAAIEQVIRRQLDQNGGRLQASSLFTILNKLPEYRVDRQGAGKKPLNYLTSTFGEAFDFENDEDKTWVSVKGWQPPEGVKAPVALLAQAKDAEEMPAVEEVPTVEAELPVEAPPEDAPVGDAPPEAEEMPAPESVYEAAQVPPVDEDEAATEMEPAPEADGEVNLAVRLLVEGGMDAETAEAIVGILSTATDRRAAYNAIRSRFGSTDGRRLYNQAKEILENRE